MVFLGLIYAILPMDKQLTRGMQNNTVYTHIQYIYVVADLPYTSGLMTMPVLSTQPATDNMSDMTDGI